MTHKMTMLVLQLAVIVIATRFMGWVFAKKLRQPEVLGELFAGILIGPYLLGALHIGALHGPLFPMQDGTIPVTPELYGIATLGSIVLLFISGLETDVKTFIQFSAKGTLVGLGGVFISFFLGSGITVLALPGVSSFMDPTALFLGVISTATSVGITARILSEKRKLSSPEGVTILAAAVLDDVLSIVLLAVVVGMAGIAASGGDVNWGHIGVVAGKAVGFWLICTVLGIIIAPRITRGMKYFDSLNMIAGVALGLSLFLAGLSELSGLAMIIGAYITGLSFSQTDVANEIHERIHGIYDFLVPIFFCVMGMMVNFEAMRTVWVFGLIFTIVAFLGKIVGCGAPSLLAGFNLRGAFRIGTGMLPRGEVTLIVAGIGLSSGAIGNDMFGVAIMTMLFASMAAPPLLIKAFSSDESGYRKSLKGTGGQMKSIELEFPSWRTADFMRRELLDAFSKEGFYSHRPDHHRPVYQVRKDEIIITLILDGSKIILSTQPENEQFVRLLMMEELLDLKDFLSGLESMQSPDMMGAELLMGMFSQEAEEDSQSEKETNAEQVSQADEEAQSNENSEKKP